MTILYSIRFLVVATKLPDIYHGCSTRKKFWEYKFTVVKIKICGRINVRKQGETNYGKQFTVLDISYMLDGTEKRNFTSSQSRYYMGIPGKGLTTSLYIRTKIPNKKNKAWFAIIDINHQDLSNLLKKFKFTLSKSQE